jgi:serine/threonine protein kinase
MSETFFESGKTIKTQQLKPLTIEKWLGGGGQGDVYKVNYDGRDMALKWYKKGALKNPHEFRDNIAENIKQGSPSEAFLWPEALTEELNGTFGYVMKLLPGEYKSFPMFLNAKVRFKNRLVAIEAALKMVNHFKHLHNRGYSYQDINYENISINPVTGDVLICDCDNIAPYGSTFGIGGKPGYVAPEIVVGDKAPSVHTDRFSLAVILFLTLVMSRPFEGKMVSSAPCLTESLDRKFFGEDPVFIFNPNDHRNVPVRGIHKNAILLWPTLPTYIREAFNKTFVTGVRDLGNNEDERRTTDAEWEKLLFRLRDETIICPDCGYETVYPTNGQTAKCINDKCNHKFSKLHLLKVGDAKIVLIPGAKLYASHFGQRDKFTEVHGEVVVNKKDATKWGLKNISTTPWQEFTLDGKNKMIGQNNAVRLESGVKISFGNGVSAEII